MSPPITKYDIMSSIASRKKEMEDIHIIVNELLKKVKQLNQRHDELKNLNFLDNILLKEIDPDGTN